MWRELSLNRERDVWNRLLRLFDKSSEQSESDYVVGSWEPYLNFFVALFFFLASVGTAEAVLPNAILFFGIATFFGILSYVALAQVSRKSSEFTANCALFRRPIDMRSLQLAPICFRGLWRRLSTFKTKILGLFLVCPAC